MTEIQSFLKELKECQSVPIWVRLKSEMILNNKSIGTKSFLTGEEMINLSEDYFQVDKCFFIQKGRQRKVVEKKHLIRYALYLNGISFEDIAKLMNCDRTTTYNSLKFIKDVTSVDKDFRNEVDNFLNYLEVKKIK